MILFDTLDELESYLMLHPLMQHVITIMDRSLPYDNPPGAYTCQECDLVSYVVDAFVSGDKGQSLVLAKGQTMVEICLEGEELISSTAPEMVFKLSQGRFLLVEGPVELRRGVNVNLPQAVKCVRFNWKGKE